MPLIKGFRWPGSTRDKEGGLVIHGLGSLAALGEWAAVLTALAGAFWWTFNRGKASAQTEAKLKELDEARAEDRQAYEELKRRVEWLEVQRGQQVAQERPMAEVHPKHRQRRLR
jgi:predicted short-subunit dehydrogenase-like oxidoreductase (DUF2520 family)